MPAAGKLEDKVCIVTGGGRGFGRATALEMARSGARLVVSGVSDERGEETARTIREEGGEAIFVHCDVREEEQVTDLMDRALEEFGAIDVLNNNAGVHETYFSEEVTLETLPAEVWDRVISVNLRGVFLCSKHALPHLRKSRRGPNIVNCASLGGVIGYSPGSAYCPSKAGVIQLTKVIAIEGAPDVRCNSYSPGTSETDMHVRYRERSGDPEAVDRALTGTHLIPRVGQPVEIARLVCFLASDDASFITGANYMVDGGASAWRGTHG